MMKCDICNNTEENKTHIVKEMMYGYRDKFEYLECSKCGCLHIVEIPENIEKYYPENYYSYVFNPSKYFDKFPNKILNKLCLNSPKSFLRDFLVKFAGKDYYFHLMDKITPNMSILDVGCGAGMLLYILKNSGYDRVCGIDPFIKSDIDYPNGLKILKKNINEMDGKWDLITCNSSFEHMDNQLEVLKQIYNLLNNDGKCIISIPTVSSWAWETYGIDWVQLDAPRHFYLHSIKSMEILANQAGFTVENRIHYSNEFQIWGSIQYQNDIPMYHRFSYYVKAKRSMFKKKHINEFKKQAKKLNEENKSDMAYFYLKKIV